MLVMEFFTSEKTPDVATEALFHSLISPTQIMSVNISLSCSHDEMESAQRLVSQFITGV